VNALAETWDMNLPDVLRDFVRDAPGLVVTELEPDGRGHRRYLLHKPTSLELTLNHEPQTKGYTS